MSRQRYTRTAPAAVDVETFEVRSTPWPGYVVEERPGEYWLDTSSGQRVRIFDGDKVVTEESGARYRQDAATFASRYAPLGG